MDFGAIASFVTSLLGTPFAGFLTDLVQNEDFGRRWDEWATDQTNRFGEAVMSLKDLQGRIMGTAPTGGTQGGFSVGGQPATGGVDTASIQTRTGGGEWTPKYPAAAPAYASVPEVAAGQVRGYGDWAAGVPAAWDAVAAPITAGHDERTAAGVAGYEDIVEQANRDYDTAMFMVEGAGAQQRRDIDEAYRVAGAGERARLNELGLGGTTIAPTMVMGYERERLASQGRLEDALLQQRLGVHSGYGANILNAMGAQQAFGAGLSGEALAAQTNLGVGGFNAANQAQLINLGAQGEWQMVPINTDIAMTGQMVDLYGNVVAPPPNRQPPIVYN